MPGPWCPCHPSIRMRAFYGSNGLSSTTTASEARTGGGRTGAAPRPAAQTDAATATAQFR